MFVADLLALAFVLIFLLLYMAGVGFLIYRIVTQPLFTQKERVRYITLVVAIPVFGAFIYISSFEPGLKQNAIKKPPFNKPNA